MKIEAASTPLVFSDFNKFELYFMVRARHITA